MGNGCNKCVSAGGSKHGTHGGSIVPDQDPLLTATSGRVQRCEIGRDFDLSAQVLGTGYSGAVRMAVHRVTGQQVAVKQFSKRQLKPHRLQLLQSEVEVYLRIDHPNICRLLYAYEGKDDVWLVMELCGCQLFERLHEKKIYREKEAAQVMLQMLQAVSYLHSHRIVHRDLKLENWMYGATDREDKLKVIDFGFSRILSGADETLYMPCGTLHYTSPEVLSRKYTSKCDIWSLGVISHMLLLGRPPFRGSNNLKLARAIIQEDFSKEGRWTNLSNDAKSFVSKLLQKDASRRPDALTALNHPWLVEAASVASFRSSDVNAEMMMNLQKFARGSHVRKAALTMMAYSMTSRELQDLEESFIAIDKSGRGAVTIEEFTELVQRHIEVSPEEVARIFQGLDFSNDEELRYTPFIAAMLATRLKSHEDKVRVAFDSFDRDSSGFITAENLVSMFHGLPGEPLGPGSFQGRALTKGDAEQWIREVDYKGNGVIDYDGFVAALMGKKPRSVASLDSDPSQPTVKVFEAESGLPRGMNGSFVNSMHRNASSISTVLPIDSEMEEDTSQSSRSLLAFKASGVDGGKTASRRSRSCERVQKAPALEAKLHVRTVFCEIDDAYFA